MLYINYKTIVTLIVILLFYIKICFTKESLHKLLTNNNNYTNNDAMAKIVMNILENCFSEKLDMVTIAGDCQNFKIWRNNFPPQLLIYRVGLSGREKFKSHQKLKKIFRVTNSTVSKLYYPSKLFIVFSPQLMFFKKLLKRMKKSVTWKSRSVYFIVNEQLQSCEEVDDIFREVWKMNIYNAVYACFDESRNVQFFCFNPYKNASSEVWSFSHFTPGVNNNVTWPMAIFKFLYNATNSESKTCPNPVFGKIQDVNNYPVFLRAIIMPTLFELKDPTSKKPMNSRTLSDYKGPDSEISQILWPHIRAQPFISLTDDIGYIDKNNTPTGLIRDLINNEFDMSPNKRYVDEAWRLQTFPHIVHGICIMTLARGHPSPPFGISFSFKIIGHLLLLCIAATLTLIYVVKLNRYKAYFEVLKLLLNTTTKYQTDKSSFRRFVYIYIAFIFLFYNLVLTSTITSGRYSHTDKGLPQNFDEIIPDGYLPMGHGRFREFMDGKLAERFQVIDIPAYLDTLFSYDKLKIACFCDCQVTRNNISFMEILVSDPLYETFVAHLVREDWPLLPTVNGIIHRLTQAGIIVFFDRLASNTYEMVKYDRKKMQIIHEKSAEPIPLKGVQFYYYFLLAGDLLALLIFWLEYFYGKCYRRKVSRTKLANLVILRSFETRKTSRHK